MNRSEASGRFVFCKYTTAAHVRCKTVGRTRQEARRVQINIHDGDDLHRALKKFRRKVQRAGIMADIRRKRHYEKPSDARRRKLKASARRRLRTARRRTN